MSSYETFPATVIISFPMERGVALKTISSEMENGVDQVRRLWPRPKHTFKFTLEQMPQTEYDTLKTFLKARMMDTAPWLWDDPREPSIVATPTTPATGDGAETVFALPHRFIDAATFAVALNSVPQPSGWTLNDDAGLVTFSTPPAAGVVVTADYRWRYLLRATADMQSKEDSFARYDVSLSVREVWP